VKKSNQYDFVKKNVSKKISYEDSSTFKALKLDQNNSGRSNINKSLCRMKSSKYLNVKGKREGGLGIRRSSHNSLSTHNLFHLPSQSDFKYSKNFTSKNKVASKFKKGMFGNIKNSKSGSSSTKNKSKVRIGRSISFVRIKPGTKKKLMNHSNSISNFRVKKISSTKQPSKPSDIRHETVPENEGSSMKGSKNSMIKHNSSASRDMKKSGGYLNQRHYSIQIDLYHQYPKSEFKRSFRLEQENEEKYRTEMKNSRYFDRESIDNLRKSSKQKSKNKNKSNFEKIIDKKPVDKIRKQLNFNSNQINQESNKEENMHPNCLPLKTNRTINENEKQEMINNIPL